MSELIERYHYTYIHNVFGDFIKNTMDYFAVYLYPRFEWKVVGTYDKAIEYLNKTDQYSTEVNMPNRAGLILNPSGDMDIDGPYGKMISRFPNLASRFTKYTFDPIYQDENLIVTVGFTRLKGEIELLALLPSFYEYFDFKILTLQMFRGIDRYIYPFWFDSFIIIPTELYNYEYTNQYTGLHYKIDWDHNQVTDKLIETTNKDEKVYPCRVLPYFKLTGISDGSTRLGGLQNLPDWRITVNLEYEIEIPSFIVLESDYLAKYMNLEIRVGSRYAVNQNIEVPDERLYSKFQIEWGLDSTSNSEIIFPDEAILKYHDDLVLKTRYYHILTQEEKDLETDLEIILPEVIEGLKYVIIISKYDSLSYGDDYSVRNNNETIVIKKSVIDVLDVGDVLEIFMYVENVQS